MNSKSAWIGTILLVFGTTLAVSSFFSLYYWEVGRFGALELPIAERSSGTCLLNLPRTEDMKNIEVRVSHARLDILDPALNYGHLWNFTLTLHNLSQNVSVTLNPDHWPVEYVFDISEEWYFLNRVTITNPEDFPVHVIVETRAHRLFVNSNWQIAMYSGIVSAFIGIAALLCTRTIERD